MKKEFMTKEGGSVARASEGELLMGANPFGLICVDCGTVLKVEVRTKGEDLFVLVKHDEEETKRYREHIAIPEGEAAMSMHLFRIAAEVDALLLAIKPKTMEPLDTIEGKVSQISNIVANDRQLLANWSATGAVFLQNAAIVLEAIRAAFVHYQTGNGTGLVNALVVAEETLIPLLPQEMTEKKLVILGGMQ